MNEKNVLVKCSRCHHEQWEYYYQSNKQYKYHIGDVVKIPFINQIAIEQMWVVLTSIPSQYNVRGIIDNNPALPPFEKGEEIEFPTFMISDRMIDRKRHFKWSDKYPLEITHTHTEK